MKLFIDNYNVEIYYLVYGEEDYLYLVLENSFNGFLHERGVGQNGHTR